MFFFTRSFLCIGAVVALAEGIGPGRLWDLPNRAATGASHAAVRRIETYCREQPARCLAITGAVAGAAAPAVEAPPPVESVPLARTALKRSPHGRPRGEAKAAEPRI